MDVTEVGWSTSKKYKVWRARGPIIESCRAASAHGVLSSAWVEDLSVRRSTLQLRGGGVPFKWTPKAWS